MNYGYGSNKTLVGDNLGNGDTSNDKLSKYEKIRLVFILMALMCSIATVIMVWRQVGNLAEQTKRNTDALNLQTNSLQIQTDAINLQRRSVEEQSWRMISQDMQEINKLFIKYPDLYPYFNQKKKVQPNDKIYPQVISMADMLLDFMDGFEDEHVRKLSGMEDKGKYWTAWENYFQDQFRLSPELCKRYKEVKSWYTENGVLEEFARKGCAEVEQDVQR